MPNRPLTRDYGKGPTTDTSLVIGGILAAAILFLLLFGPHIFGITEKSVDVSKTQPSIETPGRLS